MFYDLLPYQSLLSITTCSINILSEKAFLRNILNLLFPSVCTMLSVPCNTQGDRGSLKPYLCNSVTQVIITNPHSKIHACLHLPPTHRMNCAWSARCCNYRCSYQYCRKHSEKIYSRRMSRSTLPPSHLRSLAKLSKATGEQRVPVRAGSSSRKYFLEIAKFVDEDRMIVSYSRLTD